MTVAEFSVIAALIFIVIHVAHAVFVRSKRTRAERRWDKALKFSFWAAVAFVGVAFISMFIWPALFPTFSGVFKQTQAHSMVAAAPGEGEVAEQKAEVRDRVKDSQMVETLEFYRDPKKVDPVKLAEYWLPDSEALKDIRASLADLNAHNYHYGPGSKCVAFTFRYVTIDGTRAEVGTSEEWYLPTVRADGSHVKERIASFGPYNVDYTLKLVKDHWLIETTTTPYRNKK